MGPDGPVYLWWARLASLDGLQIANWRPGVPALSLTFGGTLRLTQVQVLAAFGGVFAAVAGLAAAGLTEAGLRQAEMKRARPVALLAGVLAGAFAVNLAGGYFGNIVFVALLLGAAAALAGTQTQDNAGIVAAAILLAGGGLAHPLFFLAGAAILVLTAVSLRKNDPSEARRTLVAAGAGGAVVGAGMLAMLAGPRPPAVDTSADAFLRRSGLTASLAAEYRERLWHHVGRYVLWLSVPLAFWGRKTATGFVRAFLRMWIVVTLIGLVAAFATDQFPGLRMLSFAFALPILAALGLGKLTQRWTAVVAIPVVVVLAGAMVFAAALTWFRERPYMNEAQVAQVREVASTITSAPVGTPVVFVVDERNPELVAFRVTDWGNVIRAWMPPERIRDVHLYVGAAANLAEDRVTNNGNERHDTLSKLYLEDLHIGVTEDSPKPIVCVLATFNPPGTIAMPPCSPSSASAEASPVQETADAADTRPATPWSIIGAGVLMFAFLAFVGFGWSASLVRPQPNGVFVRLAIAPALGAAVLVLGAIAADRVGFRLTGGLPVSVSLLACLGGYLFAWRQRRLRKQPGTTLQPAAQIDE